MKGLSSYLSNPLSLILSILLALSLIGAWMYASNSPGEDYYVAWVVADAVKNDAPDSIYDPSSRYKLAVKYRNKADALVDAPRQKQNAQYRQELPITATPFLYWVTGMIAVGSFETDLSNWHLLSLFLLTASVLVTCRLLGYPPATSLALLLPIVFWFAPLHSDLRVANVNSIQLGVIGLILWLQSRGASTRYVFALGLTVSLLVMFKPNLAPIALLLCGGWLVRKQYSRLRIGLAGMVTGAAAAFVVSSWWLGRPSAWFDWLNVIGMLVDIGPAIKGGNYAPLTQITGGADPLNQLFLALFYCSLCIAFFWWGCRRIPAPSDDGGYEHRLMVEGTLLIAMGCIISMLASALVWFHYYVLTIPMFVVALRPWSHPGPMKAIPILMLRLLPVFAFVCLLDTTIVQLTGVDSTTYWATAATICVSTLFVIGLWQLAYGIKDQRDPGLAEELASR